MRKVWRPFAALGFLLMGCALMSPPPEPEPLPPIVRGPVITARGFGRARKGMTNVAQRRSVSRDAAILDAQSKLLVKIKRLRLRRKRRPSVGTRMKRSRKLRRKIKAILHGAEIVKSTWKSHSRTCTVEILIPKKRLEDAVGARLR